MCVTGSTMPFFFCLFPPYIFLSRSRGNIKANWIAVDAINAQGSPRARDSRPARNIKDLVRLGFLFGPSRVAVVVVVSSFLFFFFIVIEEQERSNIGRPLFDVTRSASAAPFHPSSHIYTLNLTAAGRPLAYNNPSTL